MLSVEGVAKAYRGRRVLDGVSLAIAPGEALGLVGGSGGGKSTLARIVLGLERPDAGRVLFQGRDVHATPARTRAGRMQAVFPDPHRSLDPRMRVGAIVAETLRVPRPRLAEADIRARVSAMLAAVALPPDAAARYPHAFSGGQRQRIAIARALVTNPDLVVADEPVSALDAAVRDQVLALIAHLRERFGTAWLFIGHDLAVVRAVTDRIAVLHAGRIVEEGPSATVLTAPRHPVTQALADAAR